jgi:N-acyl-D-aspartate/D-glutamate deacylase
LIRNGLVFDGSCNAPLQRDLLIEGERLEKMVEPGQILVADRVVDAKGCWVTPGFIDLHTHYDAELALNPALPESVRHGVTTVVLGSCSVSFVASSAEDCSDMFTRVESVPRELVLPLLKRIKSWDSASGWRRWLEDLKPGPNIASFIGHSDLRCRAMGLLDSVSGKKPGLEQQSLMEKQLSEALDCGFLGMSSMTNPWDKLDGERAWSKPLPSVFAGWGEQGRLEAILRERGAIHQSAPNLVTRVNVLGMILSSMGLWRKPLKTTVITMMDVKADPYILNLTRTLGWLAKCFGADFRWQSPPAPFELYYDGMDSVLFEEFPAGQAIRHLAKDKAARTKLIADPAWRAGFRKELKKRFAPKVWHRDLGDTRIVAAPDSSLLGKSFVQVAEERQQDPVDCF